MLRKFLKKFYKSYPIVLQKKILGLFFALLTEELNNTPTCMSGILSLRNEKKNTAAAAADNKPPEASPVTHAQLRRPIPPALTTSLLSI